MVNRILAPAQEHIARELYRGGYRSRSPAKAGPRRQLAVYSRGGFAEEGRQRRRRRRGKERRRRTGEHLEI